MGKADHPFFGHEWGKQGKLESDYKIYISAHYYAIKRKKLKQSKNKIKPSFDQKAGFILLTIYSY